MALASAEAIIFSRYGPLGNRVVKSLLRESAMEDRFIAEECIASLSHTRELLHRMFRDGFIAQQEIPKTSSAAERAPKLSLFLWTINKSHVLQRCTAILAKSWRNARARLKLEHQVHEGTCGNEEGEKCSGAVGAGEGGDLRSFEAARFCLEVSVLGLAQSLLALVFF
jgi:transcription initiation factor IIE alpha subunit